MANVIPAGPGQPESIGSLSNPRQDNDLGWYKDPESGVVQHVSHPSAADALVRLGWGQLNGGPNPDKYPEEATAFAKKHFGAQAKVDVNQPQIQAAPSVESELNAEVGEEDTQEGNDNYKEVTLQNGNKRYYRNGVQISATDYTVAVSGTANANANQA